MSGTILAVAAGGALGALGRYGAGLAMLRLFGDGFPVGTLFVNIIGSFLMGFLAHWFLVRGVAPEWRHFILVGMLGALTTFSTFSLDAVSLYERGEPGVAAIYVLASVILSLGGLIAGLGLSRSLF